MNPRPIRKTFKLLIKCHADHFIRIKMRHLLFFILFCFASLHNAAALQKFDKFDLNTLGEIGPIGPVIDDGVNAAQDFTVSSQNPASVG